MENLILTGMIQGEGKTEGEILGWFGEADGWKSDNRSAADKNCK